MFLFLLSVTLAQNTTGITTATTMAAAGRNNPLASHMRPGAPCRHVEWIGDNPPSLRIYFLGGSRVFMDLKALLCSGDDELPQHQHGAKGLVWGTLGGHFCRRRLWLAMVVMVDVGRWRHTVHLTSIYHPVPEN